MENWNRPVRWVMSPWTLLLQTKQSLSFYRSVNYLMKKFGCGRDNRDISISVSFLLMLTITFSQVITDISSLDTIAT